MRTRILSVALTAAFLSLLLAASAAGSGQSQAAGEEPAGGAPGLPPVISARIIPSRVVYLGSAPGSNAQVVIQATGTVDPEGKALEYGCDSDGDGVFTPWFFHEPCAETVTMAGPFVASLHVRDEDQAVTTQSFHMEARQFETAFLDTGWGAPALTTVAGRPALTYLGDDGLMFAINSQRDGEGAWTSTQILPIDFSLQTGETAYRPCPLALVAGRPAVACAYRTTNAYPVMYAASDQSAGSGRWEIKKVIVLGDDSAPVLGIIQAGPAVTVFQDGAVTLLVGGIMVGSDAVMVSEDFELLTSFDVGPALPTAHSGMVTVGGKLALPALAFLDAKKGMLTYAVNQQSNGRGKWDTVAVEPQSGDIGAPVLAMLDGRPGIVYRDGAKGNLRVALAGTPDGRGAWKITVVAPRAAKLGHSLALIDGRPAVAFQDDDHQLLFAYDPGFDNGQYWPSAVVDVWPSWAGDGYLSPSLALIAGRPAIVYNQIGGTAFAAAR